MSNQQLIDFITQQLQKGVLSKEKLKEILLNAGWKEQDIDEAFSLISSPVPQPEQPLSPPTSAPLAPPTVFPAIPALPKKRKWKKIILIIAGMSVFLIAVIIFLPSFLNLFAKDIPPINDSDILLKKVNVPDNQNAYFDLIKLDNIIYEPEGKSDLVISMAAGKAWDAAVAEEIVFRNGEAFGHFAQAAQKPKFQDPISADPANITPNAVLPSLGAWRRMARLSAIRAMYLAKQGKDKEAIEEALNSVKIGQKIQESHAPLVEYLVAIAMKGIGLEAMQNVVSLSNLSSSELISHAQELNAFYNNEDGLINSFKSEYHILSRTIDALAGGNREVLQEIVGEKESEKLVKKSRNNYYFQPNKTKLLFADYIRANIKSANQPCGEINEFEVPRLATTNPFKLYIEENAVGKILHDIVGASLTNVSTKKCEEDLLVGATQTIVALKAYKNDTGNYPSSLNDLVPLYLSTVPIDPFDGKALRYSFAKKVVYSVGQDLQDSGGSTGDDWRQMPDPTFNIDFYLTNSAAPASKDETSTPIVIDIRPKFAGDCNPPAKNAAFNVFRDGNIIGEEIESPFCESGGAIILAQNKDYVYFSIEPGGIGGYILTPLYKSLYRIDLSDNKITRIIERGFGAHDFTSDFKKVFYGQLKSGTDMKKEMVFLNSENNTVIKKYSYPTAHSSGGWQYKDFTFSPQEDKIAFVAANGPDDEKSEIYILSLNTGDLTLIQQKQGIYKITGWKDDETVVYEKSW